MAKAKTTTKKKTKVKAKKPVKKAVKKSAKKTEIAKALPKEVKTDKYYEAVGRRKTAIARVRLFTKGEREILVGKKQYKDYFSISEHRQIARAALERMKCLERFKVTVLVKGGGHRAQAEAIRHATSRALVKFNPEFKKRLRRAGYLTRDQRMRERKKFGLKRARRGPQWSKR